MQAKGTELSRQSQPIELLQRTEPFNEEPIGPSKKPIKGRTRLRYLIMSKMTKLDDDARKILEGKNFIFLATVNPDGSPQVTPTWVDTDGHYVLINTAKGRVIEQVTGKFAEDHIDKMAKKYTGAEKYPNRKPGEKRVLLKIEPHHVSRMR